MFAALGAKLAFGWAKAQLGWSRLSPRAKLILLGIIAALILGFVHQLYAHRQAAKQFHAGYVKAQADAAAKAAKEKAKLDAATARIAQLEKDRINEERLHIRHSADTLILRGPGRAVCAEPAAPASGPINVTRPGNAAVDRLPDQGGQPLIALPFNDTVRFAQQSDSNAAELSGWHRWYQALEKAWPKSGDRHR